MFRTNHGMMKKEKSLVLLSFCGKSNEINEGQEKRQQQDLRSSLPD